MSKSSLTDRTILRDRVGLAEKELAAALADFEVVLAEVKALPSGLKTGIVTAIEDAFERTKTAERYLRELHDLVLVDDAKTAADD